MKLAQTFITAVRNPDNITTDGSLNWNFVDADCYMACANDYPNADAFYDEFNALCELWDGMNDPQNKVVDTVEA